LQGDRFVDAIPITRRSRRVLAITMPGVMAARVLMLHEPASKQRLSTSSKLRQYAHDAGIGPADEAAAMAAILGLDGPEDSLHQQQIVDWVREWFAELEDPASKAQFTFQIGDPSPMTSLRDVEAQAPIHD